MTLIIDASVAIKWVVEEPGSEEAARLLPRAMLAPDLFQAEVGHVLTKRVRRKLSTHEQAQIGFDAIMTRVTLVPMQKLGAIALDLSLTLSQSMYDCVYSALAETSGHPLVTADAVFVAKLRDAGQGSSVYALGEEIPDA